MLRRGGWGSQVIESQNKEKYKSVSIFHLLGYILLYPSAFKRPFVKVSLLLETIVNQDKRATIIGPELKQEKKWMPLDKRNTMKFADNL